MLLTANQARAVFATALCHRFALLAVNADSPAAVLDCLDAARLEDAPIIIETSLWQLTGRSFGAGDPVIGLARYLADIAVLAASPQFQSVPVIFHTDHIKGPETLRILGAAIRGVDVGSLEASVKLRASTLSLDSSELDEATNIQTICELGRMARDTRQEVALEMEAGVDHGVTPLDTADRLLGAVESVNPGDVILWAPGVGTTHGLGSQDAFSPTAVESHQKRASQVTGREVGIALHGSSGLDALALRSAVAAGVTKVNWSSESLLLRSTAAAEYYRTNAAKLEKSHREWKGAAMDNGVQQHVSGVYVSKVRERIAILGSSGRGEVCRSTILATNPVRSGA